MKLNKQLKQLLLRGEARFIGKGKKLNKMTRKELYEVIWMVDCYYQDILRTRFKAAGTDASFTYYVTC